ncbi:MAG: NUDIX hydrolase [Stagnimonas sp.]|nr:NUDIX hydrolase [Stagnimonas sp.]
MIRTLHKGEFLELKRDRHWEYVSRVQARGAVVIIALTDQRELVLVEQTRIPQQGKTIELPAGIVGDADSPDDESFESAALRELLEETGFRGSEAFLLTQGPTAAGLTSEQLTLIGVKGLVREHAGGGVGDEDISVHLVPLDGAHAWLESKRAEGLRVEPRVYAGLYFAATDRF